MKAFIFTFLLTIFATVNAHNVLLPPGGKRCFFENLNTNDELAISFQAGSRDPGSAEQHTIDFHVRRIADLS